MTGRALPNLQAVDHVQPLGPAPAAHKTFGLEPATWWLYFRRDLDLKGVRRMSDQQWRLALHLAKRRTDRPYKAAEFVANMPKGQQQGKR